MRYDFLTIDTALKRILKFNPKNFVEIGSRDGHDTRAIQQMFNIEPQHCYIFEAHPELFEKIQSQYPEFNVYNCAIGNETLPLTFNAAELKSEDNPGMSSVLETVDGNFKSYKAEVDGWRMDEISTNLALYNIDLVKIDVEGFSLQVLQGFGTLLENTKCIQIELEHKEVWKNQSTYEGVKEFLESKDFVEMVHVRIAHDQSDSFWAQRNLIDKK